jgi:hypothetical protein
MGIMTTSADEQSTVEARKKDPCGCRGCPAPCATIIVWRILESRTFTFGAQVKFLVAGACEAHLTELRERGPLSDGPGGRVGRAFADPIHVERAEYGVDAQ